MKKQANIAVYFTVYFEDNGVDDLKDQAVEVAETQLDWPFPDVEVLGEVLDAE